MRKRSIKTGAKDKALLRELDGLCEMGMQGEIVRMVGCLISQKPLSAVLFNEAIRALLAHGDDLKPWTCRIEKAYTSMGLRSSRRCRYSMLCFYHSLGDSQKALEFIPARFSPTVAPLELAFALDTFKALRLVKKADALVPRCLRILHRMGRCNEISLLLHSLADYFASQRNWEGAIALWEELISDDVLGPQAFVEIAAARAAQARHTVKEGLNHINLLRKAAKDDLAITLPGNFKARLDEAEMELLVIKASLNQCFPEE